MTAMNITTATNFAKVVALSSLLVVAGATQSRAGEGDVLGLLIGSAVLGTLLGFSGGLYDTTPDYRAERAGTITAFHFGVAGVGPEGVGRRMHYDG